MNDEQRRIIAEARATVARVDRLTSRDETRDETIRREVHTAGDRMTKYRADVEAQEREFAQARAKRQKAEQDERSNSDEWMQRVDARVEIAVLHATRVLAEAMRDEIDQRDKNLSAMAAHVHRLEAELCRLTTRVIRVEIGNDDAHASKTIDIPNPLRRREGLN
jgi:hypothetical protein